jgi:hypothetical protein
MSRTAKDEPAVSGASRAGQACIGRCEEEQGPHRPDAGFRARYGRAETRATAARWAARYP